MLTSIVKATRRHYAALQHRPAPDRIGIYCTVGERPTYVLWVRAPTESQRRAALTRTLNLLRAMWPEVQEIEVRLRRYGEDPGQALSAHSEPRA